MEVKRGYKQTEVGVIPDDWNVLSAFDTCSKIQDGTHFSPRISGNDYFYVTSKNIRFGYLDMSTASRIDAAQHQAIYRRCDVKKGDVLLTKDGANTGNAALNTLDEEFSLLSSVAFLRFNQNDHCAAYFLQQILTSPGQRQIQDAMSGNAITRLTLEKINKLRFPAPPTKAEQEAIAEALFDADALIESLEQLLAKKRHLKQGTMQELLTGKKRLPGFSGKWEVKRLGEVFAISAGKSKSAYIIAGGRYWIVDMGSVSTDGRLIVSKATNYFGDFLSVGDLVMPKDDIGGGGIIGKVGYIDADETYVLGDHVYRLTAIMGNPLFLSYVINAYRTNAALRKKVIGSAQLGLGRKSVDEQEVPFPSYTEQTAIAAILSDMDAEIVALETKLAKARQLKQGMMQELLTGRIRLV